MTTFGSRLSTCIRVLQKERLLTYGVHSPGQSRGISPLRGVGAAHIATTTFEKGGNQWSFLVPLIGGRGCIITRLAIY